MFKKIFGILLACVAGFSYLFLVGVWAISYFNPNVKFYIQFTDLNVKLRFICYMVICLYVMHVANSIFDSPDKFRDERHLVNRWTKILIFAGFELVGVIGLIFLAINQKNNLHFSVYLNLIALLIVGAMVTSAVLFFRTYDQFRGRKLRVIKLLRRFSNYKRRYYFVGDMGRAINQNDGALVGHAYGEIRVGDIVYIYNSELEPIEKKITRIEINGKSSVRVKNSEATLFFKDIYVDQYLHRYTVVSDVRSVNEVDKGVMCVDNPYYDGLLKSFDRYFQLEDYTKVLVDAMVDSEYLVPCYVVMPVNPVDIVDEFNFEGQVAFPHLMHTSNLGSNEKPILGVFTNWEGIYNWPEIMNGMRSNVKMMTFEEIVDIAKSSYSGIVINPFSNYAKFFPNEMLVQIARVMVDEVEYEEE